jgi:hypothetical protein
LGLTELQVRIAYGVEKRVFGADRCFMPSATDGIAWEATLMEEARRKRDAARGRFSAERWADIEADALLASEGKADQAEIHEEHRWIRANLYQWPRFKNAPSRGAIVDWLSIMTPGNSTLLQRFTVMDWSRRLRAAEREEMKKSGVDPAQEPAFTEHDMELIRAMEAGG